MQRHGTGEWRVRGALRAATGAVHERLHRAAPFSAIANRQLDVRGYADLVARIAAFHFTVGEDLGTGRLRRGLLVRDLKRLGLSRPGDLPWTSPRTGPERLGWAYVVEGSSIGGKVLYRQLDYLFGRSASGRLFFRGSGSDGPRWQALCRDLEAAGRTDRAVEEIIGGATAAFALFERAVAPAVEA
ncbi:MAG TPA: biliverdin-producing heme oxygenase [Allosphingosinicella sp.]|jgi:heme oxygenase